jgi:hypothetical protein
MNHNATKKNTNDNELCWLVIICNPSKVEKKMTSLADSSLFCVAKQ